MRKERRRGTGGVKKDGDKKRAMATKKNPNFERHKQTQKGDTGERNVKKYR